MGGEKKTDNGGSMSEVFFKYKIKKNFFFWNEKKKANGFTLF